MPLSTLAATPSSQDSSQAQSTSIPPAPSTRVRHKAVPGTPSPRSSLPAAIIFGPDRSQVPPTNPSRTSPPTQPETSSSQERSLVRSTLIREPASSRSPAQAAPTPCSSNCPPRATTAPPDHTAERQATVPRTSLSTPPAAPSSSVSSMPRLYRRLSSSGQLLEMLPSSAAISPRSS